MILNSRWRLPKKRISPDYSFKTKSNHRPAKFSILTPHPIKIIFSLTRIITFFIKSGAPL